LRDPEDRKRCRIEAEKEAERRRIAAQQEAERERQAQELREYWQEHAASLFMSVS